ncbi:MAG: hypothetical protein CVU46_04260 [Chloroflexi bacterium HGW-Chloroflexi-8]|jgi:hypothetical protein|nr:MAG: hypothetical protein CVU46_04260 [Chloroflexi bacterium HGW-Chloroflexi-8]
MYFFTLLFGPVLLLLIGFIFGNEPQALFGGYGQMDISTSAIAAIVIGIGIVVGRKLWRTFSGNGCVKWHSPGWCGDYCVDFPLGVGQPFDLVTPQNQSAK